MLPSYFNSSLKNSKLISAEQEIELAMKIQENQCQKSVKLLINANYNLVVKIAHKFQNCGLDLEDLVQEGNIGLIKAAEKFDPARGCRFSTYATWWIKQSILLCLDEKSRTVRIPGWLIRLSETVEKKEKQLSGIHDSSSLVHVLAKELDTTAGKILLSKEVKAKDFSIDFVNEEGERSYHDLLADDQQQTQLEGIVLQEKFKLLAEAIEKLNPKEQAIIRQRFDLVDQEQVPTLQEIGDNMGITNERVRQIESNALRKMRKAIMRSTSND